MENKSSHDDKRKQDAKTKQPTGESTSPPVVPAAEASNPPGKQVGEGLGSKICCAGSNDLERIRRMKEKK